MKLIILLLLATSLHAQNRPNIIYIMSDDHDADAISAYNNTFIQTPAFDRLAKEGMLFKKAFVGNSICSPARATLLTGQHSHKNGIRDNRTPFDGTRTTLPKLMSAAGYQTALVGKWHLHSLPTGFDYWKVLPGQGAYYRPALIHMNNDTVHYEGYTTEVITEQALQFLQSRDRSKPFMLLLHHKAPHRNWVPTLSNLRIFSQKNFPEPPTLFAKMEEHGKAWQTQRMSIMKDMTWCTDLKLDPEKIRMLPGIQLDSNEARSYRFFMNRIPEADRLEMQKIYAHRAEQLNAAWGNDVAILKLKYQWYMQDYLACIASVDESTGKVLDYLDQEGIANNTVVIYTSDQGFYLGENGWFDKRWMYDVSMQTPLIIRWPGHITPGSTSTTLVQNIDYAPSILDLAGVPRPDWMQGLSIKPVLTGENSTLPRKNLYYHYYEYPIDHYVLPHLGIRGERYKLIYFYTVNEWELYDLQKDPTEQQNLVALKKYRKILANMKAALLEERNRYDDHETAGELN
ncbi:MAG: sulfatase [Chitinophagaceae bacterium]|nr:sulfatase [Chitinophagaceae bacterium]